MSLTPDSNVSVAHHLSFDVPKQIMGIPYQTFVPMTETATMILGTLWAIRRQRYVVFPLVLASLDKKVFLDLDFNVGGLMREFGKLKEIPNEIKTQWKQLSSRFSKITVSNEKPKQKEEEKETHQNVKQETNETPNVVVEVIETKEIIVKEPTNEQKEHKESEESHSSEKH